MLSADSRHVDFPSLSDMTYLNTAAEGIPPQSVARALAQYSEDRLLGMDGRILHRAQWEKVRELSAALYGLTAEEIGICSCSSEAYNLARMALRLRPGDEVVINDLDYPAGTTPWLQADCPAQARLWRHREGALRVEDLAALLSPRTRLVTVSLVSFFNGHRVALPELSAVLRKHSNALLAVDVTQALGRIPLDVAAADLIVSSTHKWILASHGGGLVGVPRRRAEAWTAPAGGWFHLEDAFGERRFEGAVSRPGAASFSVGMPNYPAVYAIRAGLEYIQSVGVKNIDAAARPLVEACLEGLSALDVDVITPAPPAALAGIVAFRHPRAEEVYHLLHARNVHIMHHAGRLRVSLHGYNTAEDVECFLRQLRGVLGRL